MSKPCVATKKTTVLTCCEATEDVKIIDTAEGPMPAFVGDVIITDEAGVQSVVCRDDFNENYDGDLSAGTCSRKQEKRARSGRGAGRAV